MATTVRIAKLRGVLGYLGDRVSLADGITVRQRHGKGRRGRGDRGDGGRWRRTMRTKGGMRSRKEDEEVVTCRLMRAVALKMAMRTMMGTQPLISVLRK